MTATEWKHSELHAEFEIVGFENNDAFVIRRSDGLQGRVTYMDQLYRGFRPDPVQPAQTAEEEDNVAIHTEWLKASKTTAKWRPRAFVGPGALMLTQDDRVIIDGTVSEIRALLANALNALPEETDE